MRGGTAVTAFPDLKIYVNGSFVPADQPCISAFDRGFLYGDTVFEGIREYGGKVFKLTEHIDRLFRSAKIMAMTIPLSKEEFAEAILSTLRINGLQDAHIRPLVSRGQGLAVGPEKNSSPTVVIIAHPWPSFLGGEGISLKTVSVRKIPADSFDPRIKCTGTYVNGVMAKIEANAAGCDEALLLDWQGYVAEGPGSNFLIVSEGALLSPRHQSILNGITRKTILELASRLGLQVRETDLTLSDVYTSDEAFMCGTGAEISPVRMVDGRSIGTSTPGPVTSSLMKAFREVVSVEGTPVYS